MQLHVPAYIYTVSMDNTYLSIWIWSLMLDNLLEADFKVTNGGKFYNINSTNTETSAS